MKFLLITLTLVGAGFARPGELPSGSYLPTGGHGFGLSGGLGNIGIAGFSGGATGFGGGFNHGLAQDQKHVYFYAAPDNEGPSRLRVHIAPASSRNTKLIFVKAPSYGPVIPEVIAPPSQSEDKTLVYVLVKRPHQHGGITIPASSVVKQAKPEVYFIKYRSQQDAERQISGTLSGQSAGSNVPDLGNESNFVRTLDSGIHGGGGFIGGGSDGLDGIGGGGHIGGIETGGISTGSIGSGTGLISSGGRYGPPGISGPYKR